MGWCGNPQRGTGWIFSQDQSAHRAITCRVQREVSKKAQQLSLKRAIEDKDRRINKELNEAASEIIADLYDKMKVVVDKTAEENGFQLVFAYPDGVTREELNMPYIKELKLKPPAAQPFYVAHDVDITTTVVKKLNEQYPPIDPVTMQVVDTDRLPANSPAPNASIPGNAPPPAGAPMNAP